MLSTGLALLAAATTAEAALSADSISMSLAPLPLVHPALTPSQAPSKTPPLSPPTA